MTTRTSNPRHGKGNEQSLLPCRRYDWQVSPVFFSDLESCCRRLKEKKEAGKGEAKASSRTSRFPGTVSTMRGAVVVAGSSGGVRELLHAEIGLSFWGGVAPETSEVVDHTHPLFGLHLAGKILAIPNGRGSCTGSQVILELLLNGKRQRQSCSGKGPIPFWHSASL